MGVKYVQIIPHTCTVRKRIGPRYLKNLVEGWGSRLGGYGERRPAELSTGLCADLAFLPVAAVVRREPIPRYTGVDRVRHPADGLPVQCHQVKDCKDLPGFRQSFCEYLLNR